MMNTFSKNTARPLPLRISDVVRPWAATDPDRLALMEEAGAWTYAQLASAISAAQSWLGEQGVRPGDRVMIVGENSREFATLILAVSGMDAWPVLVNARVSAREIEEIKNHCVPRRVVFATGVSSCALDHAQHCGAAQADIQSVGAIHIGELNQAAIPEPIEAYGAEIADRVAALIYTSGTTGLPKGVMLTHRNLLFLAAGASKIRSLTREDRLYGILPISHAVGLSVVLLGSLLSGASLYLAPRFDPMNARVTLVNAQITVLLGTPTTFIQFSQYARLRKVDSLRFSALRIISSSGAQLHASTKAETEKLFGMPLHNGYGLTECSPTIAQTRVESPRSDTSIGPAFPGVEVKLVGPDRKPVPAGEAGELWVRGPNVMKGYYRAPEETSAVIDCEGWFNTRDLARMEDGNLFIVGRTKDLIVHRGFNVYPAEVEAVLNVHPAVAQSAVIGRLIDGDEEVIAFVQPAPNAQLTITDLADLVAHGLAPYKRPSQFIFATALPLTPTGKVAKAELVKMLPQSAVATAT